MQLAPALVQMLQGALGKGTGTVKGPIALNALKSILAGLLGQGKIESVPADTDIQAFIASLVAQMKTDGTINLPPSTGVSNTDWFLVSGSSLTRIPLPVKV